jgi:8-oxo-dGTP diphosphatase
LVFVKVTIRVRVVSHPDFAGVGLAVDLVVLTVRAERLHALLVRRGIPPYLGRWALPGGFVRPDEDLLPAAARELTEETGLHAPNAHLEQLASYGAPGRDPRGRVLSVAHLALLPDQPLPRAGGDASDAAWQPVDEIVDATGADAELLAFDHHRILHDGVERARAKLEYTTLAVSFCPSEFTIAELRRVYQAVWGVRLDPRNFHRKVTGTPGFVEPTGSTSTRDGGRPAQLYRAGGAQALHPPLLRGG